ncbi:hypothetical protein A5630_20805 [Mycolicibacterium mucogenicum]|uniref:DUF4328 domain-containing protein n=1 Tax=Mycolicibacterium mucogenicum TaxID=56689 RepID=A0A1A3H4D2_MYCMU|nr:hypothetical protein A5630_20805 [Mycolicibacterium mucogenicum]
MYVFVVVFIAGFVLVAGFVPPPTPMTSAAEIKQNFVDNDMAIRIGMCICVLASALLLPWGGAIAAALRTVRGGSTLAYTWISANAILCVLFIYPCLWWAVAAFRSDSSADVVRGFNDMAWLGFMGIIPTAMIQCAVLMIAAFAGDSPQHLYPRWFGYFQLWCLLAFVPDLVTYCFKRGPLAWNGVITFWFVVSIAIVWLVVTGHMTARAVKRQLNSQDAQPRAAHRSV